MSYLALYRVWRPQTFQDMVGQQHVKQTLQNALKQQHFSHAYLFSGPRGTGKTSAAKIMAKAINCENGPTDEPCNECKVCKQITEGSLMDVVEIDAASNRGVEEIREIREKIKYSPSGVRYKVYIIDEVHMLTTEAFNALLKTLEEPPAHAVFILATTEPHKLPATIISRCQRFDFRRIQTEDIVHRLAEICDTNGISYEGDALTLIARVADGGLRDATSLLDQALAMGGERVTEEDVLDITGGVSQTQYARLAQFLAGRQVAETIEWMDNVLERGKSPEKVIDDFIRFYRDLLLIRTMPNGPLLKEMFWLTDEFKQWVMEQSTPSFFQAIELLNKMQSEMKWSNHPRILLEVALIRLCEPPVEQHVVQPSLSPDLTSLSQKVAELEKQLAQWMEKGNISLSAVDKSAKVPAGTSSVGLIKKVGTKENLRAIEPFLKGSNPETLKKVKSDWARLLAAVKDKNIAVRAWFVEGDPVAFLSDSVLVSFKSMMHRDTTEKPANREIIEQSMKEVFGQSYHLVTVMHNEWQQMSETSATQQEDFALVPENPESEEPWVREAIDLFGENLVEIKDE
jgi:DNA polymerase-3 subunit gamma/tau